jgi:hypothetical protein
MAHKDTIIDEVRTIREAFAKEFDNDVAKIAAVIRKEEAQSEWKIESRPPKRVAKKAS